MNFSYQGVTNVSLLFTTTIPRRNNFHSTCEKPRRMVGLCHEISSKSVLLYIISQSKYKTRVVCYLLLLKGMRR